MKSGNVQDANETIGEKGRVVQNGWSDGVGRLAEASAPIVGHRTQQDELAFTTSGAPDVRASIQISDADFRFQTPVHGPMMKKYLDSVII